MASQSTHAGGAGGSTHNQTTKYQRLMEARPEFKEYGYTSRIAVALNDIQVKPSVILDLLRHGLSDFWIPMPQNSYPRGLSPSDYPKFEAVQSQLLAEDFTIKPQKNWSGEHFNLSADAINSDLSMPRTFRYVATIGGSRYTEVAEVKCPLGIAYALKRIKRREKYDDELEQMNYIKGELGVLRKIQLARTRHFVRLVASYTDTQYVGVLFSPVADCNLEQFLGNFHESAHPREHLLAGFFGCLATALAYLHYVEKIRHKDIKPQNILVKDNNVLIADFGISLDWSKSGCTTTHQEKYRSWRVSIPILE